jgi:hypothetical protein
MSTKGGIMLEGLAPKEKESICFLMKKAVTELDDKDLKILDEAIKNPKWSANALTDALNQRGFTISRGVIQKHRDERCGCVR